MERKNGGLSAMAMTAVLAAVLAVVSPVALPIGPIPISLCTLIIFLAVYVLGWRRGTTAVLIYVLMGAVGMPVFSGFSGGLGKILGPTGGYIMGYPVLALVAGVAVERFPNQRLLQLLGMILGTAALYALGTAWFCFQSETPLAGALSACVFPFLPGDAVKMAVACGLGPALRERLKEAGLLPE